MPQMCNNCGNVLQKRPDNTCCGALTDMPGLLEGWSPELPELNLDILRPLVTSGDLCKRDLNILKESLVEGMSGGSSLEEAVKNMAMINGLRYVPTPMVELLYTLLTFSVSEAIGSEFGSLRCHGNPGKDKKQAVSKMFIRLNGPPVGSNSKFLSAVLDKMSQQRIVSDEWRNKGDVIPGADTKIEGLLWD